MIYLDNAATSWPKPPAVLAVRVSFGFFNTDDDARSAARAIAEIAEGV